MKSLSPALSVQPYGRLVAGSQHEFHFGTGSPGSCDCSALNAASQSAELWIAAVLLTHT